MIRGQAREIKRGQKREGEMQHVRNVRSSGNTWPWQLESDAELLFFFVCSRPVLHLKLRYVEERGQNSLVVRMALRKIQKQKHLTK